MSVTAIVPLKALDHAKRRLSHDLDGPARRQLVAWMFERVLAACRGSQHVGSVLVVAGDAQAASLASRHPVTVITEPVPGLSRALSTADATVGHSEATIVVAADLPLIAAAEIDRVCDIGSAGPCAVVAPTDDGGTGALLRRPALVMPTAYGGESAAAHLRLGAQRGIRTVQVRLPGLALDVDTPGQLRAADIDLERILVGGYDPSGSAPAT